LFGNRYCHEQCAVMVMARRGEPVHGFEINVGTPPEPRDTIGAAIVRVPGARLGQFTIVHLLDRIDEPRRPARAFDGAGALSAVATTQEGLTAREREILECVAAGLQNKEVAAQLGISLATVRNHVHNILEKLGLHSKLEAVSVAFRRGWVTRRQP
jgi:DNA-binding NarL/FixJ family response regulator